MAPKIQIRAGFLKVPEVKTDKVIRDGGYLATLAEIPQDSGGYVACEFPQDFDIIS